MNDKSGILSSFTISLLHKYIVIVYDFFGNIYEKVISKDANAMLISKAVSIPRPTLTTVSDSAHTHSVWNEIMSHNPLIMTKHADCNGRGISRFILHV